MSARFVILICALVISAPAFADGPPKDEAVRRARKAARKVLRQANGGDAEALEALRKTPDAVAVPVLLLEAKNQSAAMRITAMRELGRRRAQQAEALLVKALLVDPKVKVRVVAQTALLELASTVETEKALVSVVRDPRAPALTRARAAKAVAAYPSVPAVPAMIQLLRQTASGGRIYVAKIGQRAYIKDVEVNQTGVIPVLNPVIGTNTTGATLEVKVIFYLREVLLGTLKRITGQVHKTPEDWGRWWKGAEDGYQFPRKK
jgi:hypothetical protein